MILPYYRRISDKVPRIEYVAGDTTIILNGIGRLVVDYKDFILKMQGEF